MVTSIAMAAALGGSAAADDKAPATQPSAPATQPSKPAPAPAAPAGDAAADVKAGTGVEAKAIVGEASEFPAGTKVWIWSQVRGANGTTVKHVWKRGGTEVWAANLKVKSNRWATYSRRNASAGDWTVDVVGEDGATLGTVSFTVK